MTPPGAKGILGKHFPEARKREGRSRRLAWAGRLGTAVGRAEFGLYFHGPNIRSDGRVAQVGETPAEGPRGHLGWRSPGWWDEDAAAQAGRVSSDASGSAWIRSCVEDKWGPWVPVTPQHVPTLQPAGGA